MLPLHASELFSSVLSFIPKVIIIQFILLSLDKSFIDKTILFGETTGPFNKVNLCTKTKKNSSVKEYYSVFLYKERLFPLVRAKDTLYYSRGEIREGKE